MPVSVTSPTHTKWVPKDKHIKNYGHFDRRISKKKLIDLANDPERVSRHAFLPLLLYYEKWTKFRKLGEELKQKVRPIRYASRTDSAIYAKYRTDLIELYELELTKRNIANCPIAYRAIPKCNGKGNKSNIEFARDLFCNIRDIGDCYVSVVDISSYFESLDHDIIRQQWEKLVGGTLPKDHEAIFKSVTRYSVVELEELYEVLNLKVNNRTGSRKVLRQRKIDTLRSKGHVQLCSMKDFREKVCGQSKKYKNLVHTNGRDFGIPQGTPISDLIANFYLLDFDCVVNSWVKERGGYFYRYSDDIVVVLPKEVGDSHLDAKNFLQKEIIKYGNHLKIQDKKVAVVEFSKTCNDNLNFAHLFGEASKNGLEYLGFAFNGKVVALKDATLSNAWRKLHRRSYGYAWRFVKRYRDKGSKWLFENYPVDWLLKRIIQRVSFSQDGGVEDWTFLRYVSRARKIFDDFDTIFHSQTKKYRNDALKIIETDFAKAFTKHYR